MTWQVEWAITIDEDGVDMPRRAAELAWAMLRREDSIANVFEVSDGMDMTTQVDLTTGEIGLRAWVPGNRAIADLAEYMNNQGWDFTEIVEMIRRPHKYADEYSKLVADRAFDVVAKEPEMAELEPSEEGISVPSVTVHFTPEVWIDDHAIEVPAPEDEDQDWIVSAETARAIARQLGETRKSTDWDWVRYDERVPAWVAAWPGPFTITPTAEGHDFDQGVWADECMHCGWLESLHTPTV